MMDSCRIDKQILPTIHSAICFNPWFSCCFDTSAIRSILSRLPNVGRNYIVEFNIITLLTQMNALDIDQICSSTYDKEKFYLCLIGTWNLPAPYTFSQYFINLINNCFEITIINYGLPAHYRRALMLQRLLNKPIILVSRHHAKYIIGISRSASIHFLYVGSANLTDNGLESN